jgi:hypothetical protein
VTQRELDEKIEQGALERQAAQLERRNQEAVHDQRLQAALRRSRMEWEREEREAQRDSEHQD